MPQWVLARSSMAAKPVTTSSESKRKGGGPTREQAMMRALAAIGVDPRLINPANILAAIAADPSAPPTARVMAIAELRRRDPEPPSRGKGRRSKKALALRAAARAGGKGTAWGDD